MTDEIRESLKIKQNFFSGIQVFEKGSSKPDFGDQVTIRYKTQIVSTGNTNQLVIKKETEMTFVFGSNQAAICIQQLVNQLGLHGIGKTRCLPDHYYLVDHKDEEKHEE
jgi:hypothetical protein